MTETLTDVARNVIAEALVAEARRAPDRIAVSDASASMTYGHLEERAGSLAGAVLAGFEGIRGASVPVVPVLVGRNCESVQAIHALIRAGLPFCPLDVALPPAELEQRWERLGRSPIVLIGAHGANPKLPEGVTAIDSSQPLGPSQPVRPVDRNSIAAVLFGSGSTGRAKAIVLGHDIFEAQARIAVQLGPLLDCREPATSGLMHVGSLRRIVQLGFGRPIDLIDPLMLSSDELLERIAATRCETLSVTASVARMLASASGVRRLNHVKRLRSGSEPLFWATIPGLLRQIAPGGAVVNGYGGTETGDGGYFEHPITEHDAVESGQVCWGEPVNADRVRLEPYGEPADGLVEVIVRGTVAREYLGEAELSAQRFGVDPDGTRFWRSGDLLVARPQGGYRFAGRTDELIKINGKMAEPAVTQSLLLRLPGIRLAVVLAQSVPNGAARLVAHIELQPGATISASEVLAALRAELPTHQMPTLLVRHDHLPLNANLKFDRQKLLNSQFEPWQDVAAIAPSTHREAFVIALCESVIGVTGLGMHSDLWEVGLDSIAAVELAAALGEATGSALHPDDLVYATTPSHLSQVLLGALTTDHSGVVLLNPQGDRPVLFCIPGAGGTALRFAWLARSLDPDQPIAVIEARGLHDHRPADHSIEAAANSALEVLRRIQPDGPVMLTGHSAGGTIAYEMAQQLQRDGRDVTLVLLDTRIRRLERKQARAPQSAVQKLRAYRPSNVTAHLRRRSMDAAARRDGINAPIGSAARYDGFYALGREAAHHYAPSSAAFPVALVQPARRGATSKWQNFVPGLHILSCEGEHLTMLERPHVEQLADSLSALMGRAWVPKLGATAGLSPQA